MLGGVSGVLVRAPCEWGSTGGALSGVGGGGKKTPWSTGRKQGTSPSSCRQLEAIVRIAESLSKMKLQPFATEADVEEALRLFQVSTLDAAMSGSLSGEDGW